MLLYIGKLNTNGKNYTVMKVEKAFLTVDSEAAGVIYENKYNTCSVVMVRRKHMKNEPIAIVGMGALIPGAHEFVTYWNNILSTKCFISEVAEEFWEKSDYYDTDPTKADKIYSKNAGMVAPVEFDAIEFGIPPKVMQSTSIDQMFSLVAARQALVDAKMYGKDAREFDRSRTGVIVSANVAKNAFHLSLRTNAPMIEKLLRICKVPDVMVDDIMQRYQDNILEWDEASNPGYLPSLCAGRIANRFNLGGTSCSVDAACASSLLAVKFAVSELQTGNCDIMIAGGVTMDLSNVTFMSFCKTPALSPTDAVRPFDERGNGMLLGDGVGMLVLKRLSKAQEDHDRIYAVIEGVGTSSDGKAKSIYNPDKEGQKKAIQMALQNAGIKPSMVGMVETHGTGTAVGDACEVGALSEVFQMENIRNRDVVIASAKGQIGHLRLAAGVIGMIRTSLALYHKQYLTTVGCEILNPAVIDSNFHVCAKPMPWISNDKRKVRYAGVSAFGFGGANCHIILREAESDHNDKYRLTAMPQAVIFEGENQEKIIEQLRQFVGIKEESPSVLKKYSYRKLNDNNPRLAFLAYNLQEAEEKARIAIDYLEKGEIEKSNKDGIIYRSAAIKQPKVMSMFPGQGTQKRNMLNDMTCAYPELRKSFQNADNKMLKNAKKSISELVYAKVWGEEEENKANQELVNTRNSQMSLAAVEAGLFNIMKKRGFRSDYYLGHSYGEMVALYAAGAFDEETLMTLTDIRGGSMEKVAKDSTGMTVVMTQRTVIEGILKKGFNIYVANENHSKQIVVAGELSELTRLEAQLAKMNIAYRRLEVAAAFHSSYMDKARIDFATEVEKIKFNKPAGKVISNYTNEFYDDAAAIKKNLPEQIVNPVLFSSNLKKAISNGVNIIVEIGNGRVLGNFVQKALEENLQIEVISLIPDENKDSIWQFESAMLWLAVLGINISQDPYERIKEDGLLMQKKKGTYTVPSTYFFLPETQKKIDDSTKNVLDYKFSFGRENEGEGYGDDMNKAEAAYKMQKQNADVFSDYLSTQQKQIEYIGKYVDNAGKESMEYDRMVFDYFVGFQNNSVTALKTYFDGQNTIFGNNDGNTVMIPEDDILTIPIS